MRVAREAVGLQLRRFKFNLAQPGPEYFLNTACYRIRLKLLGPNSRTRSLYRLHSRNKREGGGISWWHMMPLQGIHSKASISGLVSAIHDSSDSRISDGRPFVLLFS